MVNSVKNDNQFRVNNLENKTINLNLKNERLLPDEPPDSFAKANLRSEFKSLSQTKNSLEQEFLKSGSLRLYGQIAKNFIDTYKSLDNRQFDCIETLLINPTDAGLMGPRISGYPFAKDQMDLESWHEEHAYKFAENMLETEKDTRSRHEKLEACGQGFGGGLSSKTIAVKELGHFARDNLTIRGNTEKISNRVLGESIFEILPLYATRKGGKIATKLSTTFINAFLGITGNLLLPVTLGVSKIICDQASTVVSLTGEAITGKILGAQNHKIGAQTLARGVELELMDLTLPGNIIQYYEKGVDGVGAIGIASASIADIILRKLSGRYVSVLTQHDLGDERVLFEINQRIDYLARFLIPYGQYHLLKTESFENKKKLRYVISKQMEALRNLEKKKTKALNFYCLAILAERIPAERRFGIEEACRKAIPDTRKNSHRTARQCLATLLREQPIERLVG